MAKRHPSALRQHRRSLVSRARNQGHKARLRTGVRKLREIIASNSVAESQQLLVPTISLIDHSVAKKVLHRNAAARLKSRLTRKVQGMAAATAKPAGASS